MTEGANEQGREVGEMSTRLAAWLAWSLCLLCVALAVTGLILALLNGLTLGEIFLAWAGPPVATLLAQIVSFSVVGALIASHRPENPIGWLFLAAALFYGIQIPGEEYAVYALLTNPGSLPLGAELAWLTEWIWAPGYGIILEQLANRMDPCKDVGHGHLLEGHKDQGSGGGGSGHPKEGGRADLLRFPYHPQTLAEDEEGGQGPLARGFYGPKTAHPRHPRREEAPVGPARRELRRHARAPLRAVGTEDGRQGVDLGHEPGHPREARLDLQKKTLGATERDEQARGAFRERLRSIDSERLVFVDESSTNVALTPRYGRAPKGERSYGKAPRNWGKNVTLISSITLSGMGASMSIEGSSDTESFGIYMREVLAPGLKSGQKCLWTTFPCTRAGG